MKTNLKSEIDQDIDAVIGAFKTLGWKLIDNRFLKQEFRFGGYIWYLLLYPKIMSYHCDKINEIWIACKITCPSKRVLDFVEYVKRLGANGFPFKPFKDEDAYRQHFVKEDRYEEVAVTFFLNPDYPEGYWCNHTI